jgi:5'-AMP-activated protein kinase regulatory beta subunit
MSKKGTKDRIKRRKVTISFEAREANEAILMGDFNNWNAKIHPMKKDNSGVWQKTVMLFLGRYEYKFLVDGQWQIGSKNDQVCFNPFGTRNKVLFVSEG